VGRGEEQKTFKSEVVTIQTTSKNTGLKQQFLNKDFSAND
jgi:hypothetical protein